MNKVKIFDKEISYIKNEKYQTDARYLIDGLPDYFFEVPASSTGKYHPKYAEGDGGLVRHTKAAVKMAYELLNDPAIGDKYTSREKDLMIIAILVHDGLKHGKEKEKYVRFDHPLLAASYVEENNKNLNMNDDDVKLVSDCIKTHMGPWTTDYFGNEVLEKPKSKYQNFVHMCDYLASRKFINVNFDDDNNVLD